MKFNMNLFEKFKEHCYKIFFIVVTILIIVSVINLRLRKKLMQLAPQNYRTLKIGQIAPDFSGEYVSKFEKGLHKLKLSDYKGKKVILYFYPKDKTPFCTLQAKSLRDNFELLKKLNYEIIGVSMDSPQKHLEAIKEFDIPFKLISDKPNREIHKKYKTTYIKTNGEKSVYRITYVINEKGIITKVILNINAKNHAKQILEAENIKI